MRTERIFHILFLLQNREVVTTEQLADELKVSSRTIHRDMDELSLAGIPVYSIRGKHGGWSILESFKHELAQVTPEELQSFIASPSKKLLNDLGIDKNTIDIREKLLSKLTKSDNTERTRTLWDRVYIDTGSWRELNETTPYLEVVQRAVFENKKLKIVYKKLNNSKSERCIEPLGLVAKSNKWYVIAKKMDQFRNYRVSRIVSATMLEEGFERPRNFHLITYWEKSKTDFIRDLPEFVVKVEVKSTMMNRLTFTSKFIHALDKKQNTNSNWCSVSLTFNDKQEAIEYVLGFGDKVRVISPKYLINDIVTAAQSVIQMYESD